MERKAVETAGGDSWATGLLESRQCYALPGNAPERPLRSLTGLLRIRFWANYKRTFIQQRFAIDIESGVPDEAVEMNGYAYGTAHPRVITKSNVHRT